MTTVELSEDRKEEIRRTIRGNSTVTPSGCWQWQAAITDNGYSYLAVRVNGLLVDQRGHRASYTAFVGPIPDGLVIDHLCRNRACVNPAHLEPVKQRTNLRRSEITRASINATKTHCDNGHEYTPENTGAQGPGGMWRYCRECKREQYRLRYAKKKALTCANR